MDSKYNLIWTSIFLLKHTHILSYKSSFFSCKHFKLFWLWYIFFQIVTRIHWTETYVDVSELKFCGSNVKTSAWHSSATAIISAIHVLSKDVGYLSIWNDITVLSYDLTLYGDGNFNLWCCDIIIWCGSIKIWYGFFLYNNSLKVISLQ